MRSGMSWLRIMGTMPIRSMSSFPFRRGQVLNSVFLKINSEPFEK